MKTSSLDIFSFLDYRAYLAARLNELLAENPKYSRRFICRKLELASNNYLKLILDGSRNLTFALAPRLADVLGLGPEEKRFFLDLVAYNQAKSVTAKNEALEAMRRHRRFVKVQRLAIDEFDYLADPLPLALRELVALDDFDEAPEWIAARLRLPTSPARIRAAIAKLLRLGLIRREEGGRLRVVAEHQDSGPRLGSVPLRTYHLNMLKLAAEAMTLPTDERYFQGLTVSMPESAYQPVIERIREAVEEIRGLIAAATPSEAVYHLEVAFYPLTTRGPADRGEP